MKSTFLSLSLAALALGCFSYPIKAQRIFIDPGHSDANIKTLKPIRTDTEVYTNLAVGLKLRDKLLADPSRTWVVLMSRTTGEGNSPTSLAQRADMANNWNADRLLSIHCNAGGATGTETFWCDVNGQDQLTSTRTTDQDLARKVQSDMVRLGIWTDRRVVEDFTYLKENGAPYHLGILRLANASGVLSEIGFADNQNDKAKLLNDSWRNTFALAYLSALQTHFGAVAPVISVTPASQNYGSVQTGTSKDLTFVVKNVGGGTLSGNASVPAPFSIVSGGTYNLAANAFQTVTVRFTPTGAQSYGPNVSFTGGGGASRPVTGSGTPAPAISVTPASQSYGSVQTGTSKDLSFIVKNVGGGTLSGNASVPSPFSIVSGGTYNLAANAFQTVTVRFTPTGAQSYGPNVGFTGGGGASRPVTGSGTPAPAISVTPASQSYGSVQTGTSKDLSFIVKNVGGGTLSGNASVPSPFSIVSGGTYNLAANAFQTVTVRFTPTGAQSYGPNVGFTGGGGASRPVTGSGTRPRPQANSVSPSSPTAKSGNQNVIVSGRDFVNGLTVTLFFPTSGSTTLSGSQIRFTDANTFTLVVTLNLVGRYRLRVNNPDGQRSDELPFTTKR